VEGNECSLGPEVFRLDAGNPEKLESFAAWCPVFLFLAGFLVDSFGMEIAHGVVFGTRMYGREYLDRWVGNLCSPSWFPPVLHSGLGRPR